MQPRLKKLNTGASISGFIKPFESQVSWIDGLSYPENGQNAAKNLPLISASQVQRQEKELEEIDQIMEDIIGDDEEEGDAGKYEDKSFSPS